MNDANLIIVGAMFMVVIVAQFVHARIVASSVARLERAVKRLENMFVPGVLDITIDSDVPPWGIEKSTINEADFG
mgnify:CR=1 FL=1